MASVTVDTSGLDVMIGRMKKVRGIVSGKSGLSSNFKNALDRVGVKILEEVRKETPVGDSTVPGFHDNSQFHTDKTHLRDSWRWKLKVEGSIIEGYAHVTTGKLDDLIDLLEAGSPRHPIRARAGSVLRFYTKKGAGWEMVYTKFVDHPGFSPNKFTKRAQDKSDIYIKELVSVLQREINAIILGR